MHINMCTWCHSRKPESARHVALDIRTNMRMMERMLTSSMLWFLLVVGALAVAKLADIVHDAVVARRGAVPLDSVKLLTPEEAIRLQTAVVHATPADEREAALRAVMRVTADERVRVAAERAS